MAVDALEFERKFEAALARHARRKRKRDKNWGTVKKNGQHIPLRAPRLAEAKARRLQREALRQ